MSHLVQRIQNIIIYYVIKIRIINKLFYVLFFFLLSFWDPVCISHAQHISTQTNQVVNTHMWLGANLLSSTVLVTCPNRGSFFWTSLESVSLHSNFHNLALTPSLQFIQYTFFQTDLPKFRFNHISLMLRDFHQLIISTIKDKLFSPWHYRSIMI